MSDDLKFDQNLVRTPEELAQYAFTKKGQASWAQGPHTCDECAFFIDRRTVRGAATGRCAEHARLMRVNEGPRFRASALLCRFFEPRRDGAANG
jgi:hypothetical protein